MTIESSAEKKSARVCWSWLLTKRYQIALDLIALAAAFVLAYLLRFDFNVPTQVAPRCLLQLVCVVLIQFAALYLAGGYQFIWRYTGMADVKAFLVAAGLTSLPLTVLRLGLPRQFDGWTVPVSLVVIDTVLAFGGAVGIRVLRRAVYERYERRQGVAQNGGGQPKRPVLLIGAGRAGLRAASEIMLRGDTDLEIKGFVDDEPNKQGVLLAGVKVLGTTGDLPRLVRTLNIDHVVITIAKGARRDFKRIIEICERIPVKVRIVPSLCEILQGSVKVSRIRDLQIEDLLGRQPVQLDAEDIRHFLAGKSVMVTGAGGSIGSELVRQVARYGPSRLLLVERAEFALFEIERELRGLWPELPIAPLLADVGDEERMLSVFSRCRPQVVLHAAAHKHVPMMELNPSEAVKNNVLATSVLGELAGEFGVEAFVLISTDKAVRPTSVMGASKRVAELVIQNLNLRYGTRYVAVRFGNVIGSTGSVIPIFREQIRNGGPVTVTHPDMMRYFMTIPEAVQLVLQAGTMGKGGEIFILDMGEPVRILDLAIDTITLSGLKPFEDIDIVFTGVRAGEKLFEEIEMLDEHVTKTHHPKIFIGNIAAYPKEKLRHALLMLSALSGRGAESALRRFLNDMLPEAQLERPVNPSEQHPAVLSCGLNEPGVDAVVVMN